MTVFESARQAVDAYSENAEAWKPDHDLAMGCVQPEDLLLVGIESLREITAYHQGWQEQVLSGVHRLASSSIDTSRYDD